MMSYEEICKELIASKAVSFGDVHNFTETPDERLFENFFIFCQTNLLERCNDYDIQPARFIYTTGYNVNARARFSGGFNIIEINIGTMVETHKRLSSHNTLFKENTEIIKEYGKLEELIKISLGHIMFQAALQFTYYHELAHLVQKPFEEFISLDEQKHEGTEDKYSALKHCLEIDADIHAANLVSAHVIDFWKKQQSQDPSQENLSKLLSVAVSGILNYFMIMGHCDKDLYYMECSHPHPVIRAVYITEKIIQVAEINVEFKLDSGAILQEAFQITERFCEHHGLPNFAAKFDKIFRKNSVEIGNYIDTMDKFAYEFPNLMRNKFPDRE